MITAFKITDHKAIRLAECDSVPRIMIIFGRNGVGKSTLLYAVKESIMKNVVRHEDMNFMSPFTGSEQLEYTHEDDPPSKITSVLSRLEIARRNIIAASSLLDNNDRALADEYTSISRVYEPVNKKLQK